MAAPALVVAVLVPISEAAGQTDPASCAGEHVCGTDAGAASKPGGSVTVMFFTVSIEAGYENAKLLVTFGLLPAVVEAG